MLSRRLTSTSGYGESAECLIRHYETYRTDEVHAAFIDLLPKRKMRILDIGSGSRRDAAYFAKQGHEVTAVEPVKEMRLASEKLHGKQRIRWIDDHLPNLDSLVRQDLKYDSIWLSAVLMHLDQDQRRRSLEQIDRLVCPGSQIFITLREGPTPQARRMFDVDPREVLAIATSLGWKSIFHQVREPDLGRAEVFWSKLAFGKETA